MYIRRICYPVTVLGPGRRVGIWVTGCNRRCDGCMSPDLWRMESGRNYEISVIIEMIKQINQPVDGFTISGGEPFLQPEELDSLVTILARKFSDDIIIYSGYTLEELNKKGNDAIDDVLSNISVLIDGPYMDTLNDGMGIRGSSNQKIHILKPRDSYDGLKSMERRLQSFRYGDQILLIGIQ